VVAAEVVAVVKTVVAAAHDARKIRPEAAIHSICTTITHECEKRKRNFYLSNL